MKLYTRLINWLAKNAIDDLKRKHTKAMRDQRKEIMFEMQMPPRILKDNVVWPHECLFVGGQSADGRRVMMNNQPLIEMSIPQKIEFSVVSEDEIPNTMMTMENEKYVREGIDCVDSEKNEIHRIYWYRFAGMPRSKAIKQIFDNYSSKTL